MRRWLVWVLAGVLVANVGGLMWAAQSPTWQRRGTWWRGGLRGFTGQTIEFKLDGTLIVQEMQLHCTDDGPQYTPGRTEYGTYSWFAADYLDVTLNQQEHIYAVTQDRWYLTLREASTDPLSGEYQRGGPGVRPCLR